MSFFAVNTGSSTDYRDYAEYDSENIADTKQTPHYQGTNNVRVLSIHESMRTVASH